MWAMPFKQNSIKAIHRLFGRPSRDLDIAPFLDILHRLNCKPRFPLSKQIQNSLHSFSYFVHFINDCLSPESWNGSLEAEHSDSMFEFRLLRPLLFTWDIVELECNSESIRLKHKTFINWKTAPVRSSDSLLFVVVPPIANYSHKIFFLWSLFARSQKSSSKLLICWISSHFNPHNSKHVTKINQLNPISLFFSLQVR